jgi:hypothetical protein
MMCCNSSFEGGYAGGWQFEVATGKMGNPIQKTTKARKGWKYNSRGRMPA